MKKCVLCLLVAGVIVSGCEPGEAAEIIETTVTDPNGLLQVAAENVGNTLGPLIVLVRTIPGIPYANYISGALAIAATVVALIKSWRKKQSDTALEEIVVGINDAKKDVSLGKDTESREALRIASNQAQSTETRAKVTAIRKKLIP